MRLPAASRPCRALLVAAALAAPPGAAQTPTPTPPRAFTFGLGFLTAKARGPAATSLAGAQGVGGYLAYPLDRRGVLSVRLDLSLAAPDEELARFPLVIQGDSADVRLNGTSNLASAFAGLQAGVKAGPIRPYVHGGVGVTRYVYDLFVSARLPTGTRTSVITAGATRLGLQGGAGLRLPLAGRGGAVALDAGVQWQKSRAVDVPRRGSLAPDSSGAIQVVTDRAALEFLNGRVGLAVIF